MNGPLCGSHIDRFDNLGIEDFGSFQIIIQDSTVKFLDCCLKIGLDHLVLKSLGLRYFDPLLG